MVGFSKSSNDITSTLCCSGFAISRLCDMPLLLQELAKKVDVNLQALKRLLRCLIESGVFAYDHNGLLCNNEKSVFLKKIIHKPFVHSYCMMIPRAGMRLVIWVSALEQEKLLLMSCMVLIILRIYKKILF